MLCGEPIKVEATFAGGRGGTNADGNTETFPALFTHMQFGDGVRGAYQAIYDATTERPVAAMALYGTEGTLTLEGNEVRLLRLDGTTRCQTFAGNDGGYRSEWLDFHSVIREGGEGVGTVAQSFRNLLVIMRALDAAESGVPVTIESDGSDEASGCKGNE
jgi:predicted dehydrogenase